jgi:hypothetical protein
MSNLHWNTITENMRHVKFSSVRDFEAQALKRLVYFENAENESEPILLEKISWQTVKEYFVKQVKEIEQSWLQ